MNDEEEEGAFLAFAGDRPLMGACGPKEERKEGDEEAGSERAIDRQEIVGQERTCATGSSRRGD